MNVFVGVFDALLDPLLDLALPVPCGGCGVVARPGRLVPGRLRVRGGLCARCRRALDAHARPVVPDPPPPGMPPCWAIGAYGDALRSAVLAYKERGRSDLLRPLAAALARAVAAAAGEALERSASSAPVGGVVLVPVPSSASARRARGRDCVADLARAAVAVLRRQGMGAVVVPALAVVGRPRDSAGLTAVERAENLHGAFRTRPRALRHLDRADPSPFDRERSAHDRVPRAGALRAGGGTGGSACLIVVDDVVTTGATFTEAARALSAAGHPPVAAAALAATRRRLRSARSRAPPVTHGASPRSVRSPGVSCRASRSSRFILRSCRRPDGRGPTMWRIFIQPVGGKG